MYKKNSIERYLKALGSGTPAPGGGSAAALTGAAGAALLEMSARYTLKKIRNSSRALIKKALASAVSSRKKLTALIDRDIEAYLAYRKNRTKTNLKKAAASPLKICQACERAARAAAVISGHASKSMSTDVKAGSQMLLASARTAFLNVKINCRAMTDTKYASALEKKAGSALTSCEKLLKKITEA